MTQNATTAAPRFIPATGLTAEIDGTTVQAFWVNGAGWTVQARRDGVTIHANTQPVEHIAVALFNQLVEQYEAETAEQPAKVEAIPGNVGTMQRVSDPAHTVLALAATDPAGIVRQGGGLGYATRPQIRSLGNKGYLTVHYEKDRSDARQVIDHGVITAKGRKRLAELTKADAEAARLNAALAA
jgi:hypothetical protein